MALFGIWLSRRLSGRSVPCPTCNRRTPQQREYRAFAPSLLGWPLCVWPWSAGCLYTCTMCRRATWLAREPLDAPAWPLFFRLGGVFLITAALAVWLAISLYQRYDRAERETAHVEQPDASLEAPLAMAPLARELVPAPMRDREPVIVTALAQTYAETPVVLPRGIDGELYATAATLTGH